MIKQKILNYTIKCMNNLGKPQKMFFFSGPATKALPPPL